MRSRTDGRRLGGALWLWPACLIGVLVASACSRRPPVFPHAPVVLISIDTLRADHLPAYGYRGVETPNLEALRKDSIVFENAVSHVPLTLPSHASLFTGLLPFQHGVRDNQGYRLAKTQTTLATLLKAKGYATGAAVSAFALSHVTGISEGFDFYEDGVESRRAGESLGQVPAIRMANGEAPGGLDREAGRKGPSSLSFISMSRTGMEDLDRLVSLDI